MAYDQNEGLAEAMALSAVRSDMERKADQTQGALLELRRRVIDLERRLAALEGKR